MGMSLGQWPRLTLFGESHGVGVGVLIEGLPPGMEVDLDAMVAELERRRPWRRGLSQRTESDSPSILSGVHDGKTTGWPIVLFSENGVLSLNLPLNTNILPAAAPTIPTESIRRSISLISFAPPIKEI